MFDPLAINPPLELPVVNFKRVNVPADLRVPPLIGSTVSKARADLASMGLVADMQWHNVSAEDPGVHLGLVLTQDPSAGTLVQPNSRVRLAANFVPSERFKWARIITETGFGRSAVGAGLTKLKKRAK